MRALYLDEGTLSAELIDAAEGMPSVGAYRYRFGSLNRAYELIGFRSLEASLYLQACGERYRLYPQVLARIEQQIAAVGGIVRRDLLTHLFHLNDELTARVVLARCNTMQCGARRWTVRVYPRPAADITIAVRLDRDNEKELDFYVLPSLLFRNTRLSLAERNSAEIECFRFDTLEFFCGMSKHNHLRRNT